jgi:hypothetical protein
MNEEEGEILAEAIKKIKDLKASFHQAIEKAIVSQLEIIEGHVPTDEEIIHHARRSESFDAMVHQIWWKNELIVDARVNMDFENDAISYEIRVRHLVELSDEISVDLD